jgi:hypothetical protein
MIHGLKQASRIWYLTLSQAIVDLGVEPSDFDACMFISGNHNLILII